MTIDLNGDGKGETAGNNANDCWNDQLLAIQSLIHSFRVRGSKQEFLDQVVRLIQQISCCGSVGIRVLDENGYIPYQSHVGFSEEFWNQENMIQISKEDCSCTRLVSGTLLPLDEPIINCAGSICCNDTRAFAGTLSGDEREKYRGACNIAGYRSIGIVPICYQGNILGLIHLADVQPDRLKPSVLQFVETAAPLVGGVLGQARTEEVLRSSQEQAAIMERIVGGISSLAYVVDLDTHELIYISKELQELQGGAAGRKCFEVFALSIPCCDCGKLSEAGRTSGTWERYDSSHGRYYFAECKAIQWPDGRMMNVAFISDITKQREAENNLLKINADLEKMVIDLQQLSATLEEEIMERQAAQEALGKKSEEIERLAFYDSLTGLPNRACLNELLEAELEKKGSGPPAGALLMIDLDDIKMVNDTFGHTYGNSLITIAGQRIVSEAGSEAVVGRSGGDEFIVLAPGKAEQAEIGRLADRIIAVFCQDIEVLGIAFHMSASAGIACYPVDGTTAEELLKNADNAMYAAKNAGKNCWRFYEPAMQAEAYERIHLIHHLRHAIERGEFSLHYQPQAGIPGGMITGFEALLRWNSSEYGLVSPDRFIPLAEQSGLIQPIGQWVLQEACKFARRLARLGWTNGRIAVNVSPHQLCADSFISNVREALGNAGIKPDQLELEITENALIASLEDSIEKLDELQAMGVKLSLDDFGTGYSSLTYLQRLPVNTLKIDKAFIDMIIRDGAQKAMIGSIVELAHIMEMTVVAEGVETQEQLAYLTKCRCDRIQGYLVSRPVPEAEALAFPKKVDLSAL